MAHHINSFGCVTNERAIVSRRNFSPLKVTQYFGDPLNAKLVQQLITNSSVVRLAQRKGFQNGEMFCSTVIFRESILPEANNPARSRRAPYRIVGDIGVEKSRDRCSA
jgi:hypothetical protein